MSGSQGAGIDVFFALLDRGGFKPRLQGEKGSACCPCHDDRFPSMSFAEGRETPVVAHCNAASCGAGLPAMLDALHATRDERGAILGRADEPLPGGASSTPDAVWTYVDEVGKDLFRVHRRGKAYPCEHWNGSGWAWGMGGARSVPYQLPELLGAVQLGEPVYIVEGEKCAEAIRALGLIATCNPGGAKNWTDAHSEYLLGAARVVVLEDNDDAGREHGAVVVASLAKAGIVDVRRVTFPELPPKGDVYDWLAALGELDVREKTRRLIEKCEAVTTPDAPDVEQAQASPLACMVSLRQAAARPAVEQPSLWKGGGLPLGYYSVNHGPGAIGKTREKLRMIVLRLLARNWHCWEPSAEPFRPLVLSLEIDTHAITTILREVAEHIGPSTWAEIENKIGLLGAPDFVEPFVANVGTTVALLEMIDGASDRLGLDWAPEPANYVMIDSFTELKEDPSDKPEAYAPGTAMLKHVSRARGACLDIIHHNRRQPPGVSRSSNPADDFRGPATFLNASRFACAFDEHLERRRITWHRVSFGSTPAASYFHLNDHGVPIEDAAPPPPAAVGDSNRQLVLDALLGLSRVSDFAGAAKGAIHDAMPVNPKTKKPFSDDTVLRHLNKLGGDGLVRHSGEGCAVVYFPVDGITAAPHDHRSNGCGDE